MLEEKLQEYFEATERYQEANAELEKIQAIARNLSTEIQKAESSIIKILNALPSSAVNIPMKYKGKNYVVSVSNERLYIKKAITVEEVEQQLMVKRLEEAK